MSAMECVGLIVMCWACLWFARETVCAVERRKAADKEGFTT